MTIQKSDGNKKQRKLSKLYERYAEHIFRYLYVHSGNKQLAEDLLSDTFLKAMNSIDNFDFKHPRAWLYTIARNLLRDYWKKQREMNVEEIDAIDVSESLEEVFDKNLQNMKLYNAMHLLLPREKEIITLRFIQNLSSKEVAKILQTTPENVRIIQHRALKKMKKGL